MAPLPSWLLPFLLLLFTACSASSDSTADTTFGRTSADDTTTTSAAPSVTAPTATDTSDEPGTTTIPFLDPQDVAVDTDGCPAGPGDNGPIKIGVNGGGFNGSPHISGLQAAIDQSNETGGIDGRPIELVTAIETQSHGPEAITHINDLLDRGDLHAVVPWSGWPDPNLIADRFADECVPALFWIDSAAPDAPWTVPGLADRRAEMAVIAEWLVTEIRPTHVLVAPVEWPSSLSFGQSLRVSLENRGVAQITTAPIHVNPDIQFGTDATDVDAIVIPDSGSQCITAVDQAKRRFPEATIVVGHKCDGFEPANDKTLDGVYRLRLFPGQAPEQFNDPFSNYLASETTGRVVVAALNLANTLEGGLTRANILRAASALTVAILPIDGDPTDEPDAAMVINTRGADDRFPLESAAVEIFEVAPADGGSPGWNLLGPVIRAEGTTPMTDIDWTTPIIQESPLPCATPSGEPEIFTSHWFGEDGELDRQADIVLNVCHIDVGPDPTAELIAIGADGTEVTLDMGLGPSGGGGGSRCEGELFFDIALGEAGAIAALAHPVTVRFEIGPILTGTLTWPDDFPLAPPFGNVPVPFEAD